MSRHSRLILIFIQISWALVILACVAIFDAKAEGSSSTDIRRAEFNEAQQATEFLKNSQELVVEFQSRMQSATINEEKQAAVDEYRASLESRMKEVVLSATEQIDPVVLIAEMKAGARGDSQQLASIARLEKNFKEQAEQKTKLAEINEAQGEYKQQLVDELRATQEVRMKERQAELARSGVELGDTDDEKTSSRSPELDARLSKVKKEQEDYQKMMAAVYETTSSAEKARLIDEWRAKAEAEMTARQAELKHLEVP